MAELHCVTEPELPVLLQWLKQHLPLTWKIYGTLREQMRKKWQGAIFYTLGWPEILAVGEGPVDQAFCRVPDYFSKPRRTSVFAPNPAHARELLLWPGYTDWSTPLILHTLTDSVVPVVSKISQSYGCPSPKVVPLFLMAAYPGDITYEPRIPDDLEIKSLDPERDVDLVLATWEYTNRHAGPYVKELIRSFPSVGVFDRNGRCLGLEVGQEWGFAGMLYVRPEARGRGLAKALVCQLARKYFDEGLPVVISTSRDNSSSITLHQSLGFKTVCSLSLMYHTPHEGI